MGEHGRVNGDVDEDFGRSRFAHGSWGGIVERDVVTHRWKGERGDVKRQMNEECSESEHLWFYEGC